MLATLEAENPRRRALRRSVRIECAAESELWDDAASFTATDLSPFGIWLDADLALEVGAEVTLNFRPPAWPVWAFPVTVRAEVVRVALPRRRSDHGRSGMGLRFLNFDRAEAERMSELLRGLPPPLPVASKPDAIVALLEPELVERDEIELVSDGLRFVLCAEAPLLTEGRVRPRRRAAKAAGKSTRARQRAKRRGAKRQRRAATELAAAPASRKPKLRLVS